MTVFDPLAQAKSRPLFVERAVRTALQDAIAWRIGGGGAPRADAFVTAAIAAARLDLDGATTNRSERSHTLAAANSAARRFAASALYRRLMAVPASQFLRLRRSSHGPDVVVRDRRRRVHAIRLTMRSDAFDAGKTASRTARETPLPVIDRLSPLTVHVFSLTSGKRHAFARDVLGAQLTASDTRVA